jgi:hypothetical protein
MAWKKSSPELIERFGAALPDDAAVQRRQMFGYPAAFVGGNFWVGLHEERVVVRLPDGLHERFAALAGAKSFDPMGGRPMKGWFVVPAEITGSAAKLRALLGATLAEVVRLPKKAPKPKKAPEPKKATPAKRAGAPKARPRR